MLTDFLLLGTDSFLWYFMFNSMLSLLFLLQMLAVNILYFWNVTQYTSIQRDDTCLRSNDISHTFAIAISLSDVYTRVPVSHTCKQYRYARVNIVLHLSPLGAVYLSVSMKKCLKHDFA